MTERRGNSFYLIKISKFREWIHTYLDILKCSGHIIRLFDNIYGEKNDKTLFIYLLLLKL